MEQARAPLWEALRGHARARYVPLHFPAHKQGRWCRGLRPGRRWWPTWGRSPAPVSTGGPAPGWGEGLACWAALDFTELPGLDDLHLPTGPILEAQALAAEALGADQAWFLVGGSTVGVQAMLLGTCAPGDLVLLPRDAHPSAVAGLALCGARPLYLRPRVDESLGLALGLEPSELSAALDRAARAGPGGARAVLLVDPTYWGLAGTAAELCALARRRGALALVDAAHGGHFHFHPGLPADALESGTDLCVYGFHKTAGSFTQTAVLCRRGRAADPARLSLALKLLQTSSPSYPLLASLDLARRGLATRGEDLLGRALEAAAWARGRISGLPGLGCPGPDLVGTPGVGGFDGLKLIVHLRGCGAAAPEAGAVSPLNCGPSLAGELRERFRVQVEMAWGPNLLAVLGPGEGRAGVAALVGALERLAAGRDGRGGPAPRGRRDRRAAAEGAGHPAGPALEAHRACLRLLRLSPAQALTPREALLGPWRQVPLPEARGRAGAELVSVHPPGQVVLFPGEEIGPEMVEALELLRRAGVRPQGAADPSLGTLRVAEG